MFWCTVRDQPRQQRQQRLRSKQDNRAMTVMDKEVKGHESKDDIVFKSKFLIVITALFLAVCKV